MTTGFLNGVETQRELTGPTPVMGVDTAVIALIGTAPIFDVAEADRPVINKPKLVTNERAGVMNFGYNRSGYTIPAALAAIFAQGGAKVVVINVFDPTKHKSTFEGNETFVDGTITLKHPGIISLAITGSELDKDYTFDGKTITATADGNLKTAPKATFTYEYADPSKVTLQDIVGGTDVDGNRSGTKLLEVAKAETGFKPKIIIAPGFMSSKSVTEAIKPIAEKLKAVYYVDAESSATQSEVIKDRGTMGVGSFNTQDKRAQLFWPNFIAPANYDGEELEVPASAFAAGVRARVDAELGPHYSMGNQPIYGVLRPTSFVSFELNDPTTDSNLLNSQGITAAVNVGELRFWGNRNASFPQNAAADSFECIVRMPDYIEDSIEFATLNKMAGPISQSMIDDIVFMAQGFLNAETKKGWMGGGKSWYDPSKNDPTEIAKGHIFPTYKSILFTPTERITYISQVEIFIPQAA